MRSIIVQHVWYSGSGSGGVEVKHERHYWVRPDVSAHYTCEEPSARILARMYFDNVCRQELGDREAVELIVADATPVVEGVSYSLSGHTLVASCGFDGWSGARADVALRGLFGFD